MDKLLDKYRSLFGKDPELKIKAPGRINLIGEHTDYNQGWVMPASIDKSMLMAFGLNDSDEIHVHSMMLGSTENIDMKGEIHRTNRWIDHLSGIVSAFINVGIVMKGFNCVIYSDIPLGGGVSSSSALECGFMLGVDHLFECGLKPWKMIELSQWSNHHFLGVQGGFLDQFAILFGKKGQAIKMNCLDRSFNYIPANLKNYSWVLFDTKVKHNHVESGYNDRVEECQKAVDLIQERYPYVNSLSSLDQQMLPTIKDLLPETLFKRTKFIVEENQRVHEFENALNDLDLNKVGSILYGSHVGLKELYEVSCDELDFLVSFMRRSSKVIGSRMMGGGFGGCTINLIESSAMNEVCQQAQLLYAQTFGIHSEYFEVSIEDGCHILT